MVQEYGQQIPYLSLVSKHVQVTTRIMPGSQFIDGFIIQLESKRQLLQCFIC